MDPNANVQERIDILRHGDRQRGSNEPRWTASQFARYAELVDAYVEWIGNGGFPADAELKRELDELVSS